MKHIRTYENYRIKKNREEIIKESVLQVNDIYKVKTMIDIPQSLINAYVKKVKDTTGKNLRTFFGDVDIAEEIVKFINMDNLDVEKIPGGALMGGGQSQTQTQPQAQPQVQVEAQPQAQTQEAPQAQGQPAQTQEAPQAQAQEAPAQGEFEEPQAQAQPAQGQAQEAPAQGEEAQPAQGQAQPAQGQAQPAQGEEEEKEEGEEEKEEGEEELPL
jgi:hypothetical protein